MEDDNDEKPELSGDTLAALQAFYKERTEREAQFEELKNASEKDADGRVGQTKVLSMDAFGEDWNASQFWETATILANQLLEGATKNTTIAVVSAPSAFVQLKNILAASEIPVEDQPKLYLLEFDRRFDVFPEFVFYDFQQPLQLPAELKGSIDHIICDPPFLSEDCQTKAAMTVRYLSRSASTIKTTTPPRIIVCTGERMRPLIEKLYRSWGVRTTTFEPVHAKGLSNEFYCYANFECADWKAR